jgi:hypothetical protein
MKTKLCSLKVTIVLVLFVTCLAQQVLGSQPVAVSIIWDRNSDGRPYWSTFRSLSMQCITCLNPNDYLEIITADPDKPHLRLAQYIKSGDSGEFNSVCTILNNITCPLIADTDVAAALELAFKRQGHTGSANPNIITGFLIVTNGRLSNRESKQIMDLLQRYKERHWHLYITGTYDTNRMLLMAASNQQLQWSLLNEANPCIWLQNLRLNSRGTVPRPVSGGEVSSAKNKVPLDNTLPQQPSDKSKISSEDPNRTKKQPEDTTEYEIKGQFGGRIVPSVPDTNTISKSNLHHQIPLHEFNKPVPEVNEAKAVILPEELPLVPAYDESTQKNPGYLRYWWSLIPIAVLLCGLGIYLAKNIRTARDWSGRVNSHLAKTKTKDNGLLIARFDGQLSRLGPFDRFSSAHGGSNRNNTIRLSREGVAGRHFKLYRKGENLMLKNLVRTPIGANGNELKPHGKCRLILPAVIAINDNVKLTLELLHEKASSSERETQNENQG